MLKRKKTCIWKLSLDNDSHKTEPKEILKEIHNFYAKLNDKDSNNLGENSIDRFLNEVDTNKLTDERKQTLDKHLTCKIRIV